MPELSIADYPLALFGQLLDPAKRVFLLYLLSAGLIAIILLALGQRSFNKAIRALFHSKVWTSHSARSDYGIVAINQAMMLLLSPMLLARLTVASGLYIFLIEQFGFSAAFSQADGVSVSIAFTVCYFLLDDWSRYLLHRWMHEWPVLWCFHKVHHSARTLSPLTVYRVHPVEGILFSLRSALVQGFCTAVFIYFFGQQVTLVSVLGANIFTFFFNLAGSNLRHSHIRFSYWKPLEYLLISPFQHQLHHSSAKQHFDKNYGAMLALWDWWGGTLVHSENQARPRFGLHRRKLANEQTLNTLYIQPLIEAKSVIKSFCQLHIVCKFSSHQKISALNNNRPRNIQ